MNKKIRFKERLLATLDMLLTTGMVLLDSVILLLIIAFIDQGIIAEKDIAISILTSVIIVIPLAIVFFILSKALFPILFQKDNNADIFIIKREDFPKLYETIDEVRSICKCPKIHVVALDFNNNAYIREGSKFYLAKWKKRYLVIGVPLLLSLNERELKAVLAHECGHLSKVHGRSTYRISQKINKLLKRLDKLKKKGKPNSINARLIKRYIIVLNNLYFQLRKNHEFEADIVASKAVGKQALINSLIKMEFYDGIFNRYFWDYITKLNNTNEKAPEDIYFIMENAMKGNLEIPTEVYKNFLNQIKVYYSLPGSTHPSIAERAESLDAAVPTIDGSFNGDLLSIFRDDYESALRTLFRSESNSILTNMSLKWKELFEKQWNENYKYISDLKKSLQDLESIEKESGLTQKQRIDQAFLVEELDGINASLKIFKEAVKEDKLNITAKFHIARIFLLKDIEAGVEFFNTLMNEDAQLIPNSCYHLINYYLHNGNRSEAVRYYNYAVNFMKTNKEVLAERSNIYKSDDFLLHDLSSKTLDKIKQELEKHEEIKKAYIVVKKLTISKDFPLYIIAIKYKKSCKIKKIKSIQAKIIKGIYNEEILPWDFQIVPLTSKNINIEYNVDSIFGARIL